MAKSLDLSTLQQAVAGKAAAFRCTNRLQPAGGHGTKVFPPTYEGGRYAREPRRLPDREEPAECVLLDSVQSQANRMEEALQDAVDRGRVALPVIEADFTPFDPGAGLDQDKQLLDPVGKVTSLQVPHRVADAILRDSKLNGHMFRDSEPGQRLGNASLANATPLFELCPTALLFGMWDSTGPKGGLGAKFERAIVAEIVGIDAAYGAKTSSRIDPVGIQKDAGPIYEAKDDHGLGWTLDDKVAKQEKSKPKTRGKDGRPSEANHGNVTPTISDVDRSTGEYLAGGVTIDHAEQSIVLSLPALRRLKFPPEGEKWQPSDAQHKRDDAARTVLAAMGLAAAALAEEDGFDLRSRCLLWPEQSADWELLGKPGEAEPVRVDADSAVQTLNDAIEAAKKAGLAWREQPLTLTPADDLVKLVVNSQWQMASKGADSEAS